MAGSGVMSTVAGIRRRIDKVALRSAAAGGRMLTDVSNHSQALRSLLLPVSLMQRSAADGRQCVITSAPACRSKALSVNKVTQKLTGGLPCNLGNK